MINSILVPLDGSDLAKELLPLVDDLAQRLKAKVYFIQVVGMPMQVATMPSAGALLSPEFLSEQLEAETKEAESYLSSLASELAAKGVNASWQVVQGPVGVGAGSSIVEFAQAHNVGLIAMSTHGRSGLSRLVCGSVAEQVVREAGIPVLLINPGHKTAKRSDPTVH